MDNTNGKKYFKAEEKRSLNLQVGWMVVEPLRYIFGPRALENLKEEAVKKTFYLREFFQEMHLRAKNGWCGKSMSGKKVLTLFSPSFQSSV